MPSTSLTSRDGRTSGAPVARPATSHPPPPPRPPRPQRTLWGYWSKHPLSTILWLVIITWCFWTMPGANSAWPVGAPTNPGGSSRVPWADVVRRNGVVTVLAPGQIQPTDTPLGWVSYDYRLRTSFEMEQISLHVPAADAAAARVAYINLLAASGDRYWQRAAARLGGGNLTGTATGYWRRTGQWLLGLFIAPFFLVRSLAWTLPYLMTVADAAGRFSSDPVERERRRRRRALARHQCPACGYSILGLPERRCPECNETWGRHEMSA